MPVGSLKNKAQSRKRDVPCIVAFQVGDNSDPSEELSNSIGRKDAVSSSRILRGAYGIYQVSDENGSLAAEAKGRNETDPTKVELNCLRGRTYGRVIFKHAVTQYHSKHAVIKGGDPIRRKSEGI